TLEFSNRTCKHMVINVLHMLHHHHHVIKKPDFLLVRTLLHQPPNQIVYPKSNVRLNTFMAGASMRKKPSNKRSKPLNNINNNNKQPTMHPSSNSPFRTRKPIFLVSLISAVAVIILSWNTWSSFRSDDHIVSDHISSFEVVHVFPHDPAAFTQGLLYGGNDTLLESTGLNGRSSVREVDLETGKVKTLKNMDYSDFGEGLTLLDKRLYQVTWLRNTGFIYDRYTFTKIKKFTHGHEVHNLNELEYINNEVWANIWQSDCIARISPVDGSVIGWVLLPELRAELLSAGNRIDVLNGIAWDEDKKRLFVTGKLWPKLYEIKLRPLRKPLQAPVERLCLQPRAHF
ncbi:hypothetical protein M8C21_003203, partial [Ambrosia artemisiifolia]